MSDMTYDTMMMYSIKPHEDLEINRPRQNLEYFVRLPKAGIGPNTGIMLVIDGFGGAANSYYQINEVRPYLADRYDCIVAGVNYFGIGRAGGYNIMEAFYYNINHIYGLGIRAEQFAHVSSINQFFIEIAQRLLPKGVINLDVRCQPMMVTSRGEYQSWGVLPAIDCLQVLGELLKQYPGINRSRLIAYGHSYGGYIAQLMAKFAPNTLSVVIDKGGYIKSELCHIATGELMEPDHVIKIPIEDFPLPFEISASSDNPWTLEDETSPYYFSDSHRRIRNLAVEDHQTESATRYYIFHSALDRIVPVDKKEQYVRLLGKYHPVVFRKMEQKDVDNGTVKQLTNDLGINHQDLFDLVAKEEKYDFAKESQDNDFSLSNVYKFPCGETDYIFSYKEDYSLSVKLRKKRKTKTAKNG